MVWREGVGAEGGGGEATLCSTNVNFALCSLTRRAIKNRGPTTGHESDTGPNGWVRCKRCREWGSRGYQTHRLGTGTTRYRQGSARQARLSRPWLL